MTALDPTKIRREFPALSQTVNGQPLVYLDSAATSQKPRAVLSTLEHYYQHDNANVHRGIHELSRRATIAFEEARAKVAAWINAPEADELVWTRGTTEAINLVATAWGLDNVGEGDEILISTLEHHSNIIPWQLLARRTGAQIRYLEIDEQGRLILDDLGSLLSGRTKVVALGHVSNALGTVNPIKQIASAAHEVGALVVIDGAQGAVHTEVDVQDLGVDCYAFSGHKMCGPTGIGALWARKDLLEAMSPYQGGGEMIHFVGRDESTWAKVPHKFEAGTPNIAGAIGLAAVVDYLNGLGMERIAAYEEELLAYATERLLSIDGLRLFGTAADKVAVLSFALEFAHPHDIGTILDTEGVALRTGHHCAQPLMQRFDVPAMARASFAFYNTRHEVDILVSALGKVKEILS